MAIFQFLRNLAIELEYNFPPFERASYSGGRLTFKTYIKGEEFVLVTKLKEYTIAPLAYKTVNTINLDSPPAWVQMDHSRI